MGIIGSHLGPIITRNPVAKMIRFKSASMLAERPNRPDDGSLRARSWSSREQLVTAPPVVKGTLPPSKKLMNRHKSDVA